MLIQVRLCDASKSGSYEVSRLMKIEDLRKLIAKDFDVENERQRLFYGGKQLEDGHSVFDYGVTSNNIITLMVRAIVPPISSCNDSDEPPKGEKISNDSDKKKSLITNAESLLNKIEKANVGVTEVSRSSFYKVEDLIDVNDPSSGAWFEAKIVKILKPNIESAKCKAENVELSNKNEANDSLSDDCSSRWLDEHCYESGRVTANSDDGYVYLAKYDGYEEFDPEQLKFCTFRPRSWKIIPFSEVIVGDRILANYSVEEPKMRGFFYDCTVREKSNGRTKKFLKADIHVGLEDNVLKDCKIFLVDELFRIENVCSLSSRSKDMDRRLQSESIAIRHVKPQCDVCKDRKSVKCKSCACKVCGGKNNPSEQIICDECVGAFHFTCLDPPLTSLPEEDEWFCSECRNDETEIVRAGEKLKVSKKKAKMASSNPKSNRDWGKGMACVGREKICTIVPADHLGPIPGVEVGTMWKYRLQVSSDGVHRPHVAGIHGTAKTGACSIVLSGGYEDDVDNGDEFTYTGSGGRDLSGNKRTAKQSFDQELKASNLALAVNCNASVNQSGATAKDWRKGKPIRVLRSAKGRKHSIYAPEEGIRYDGIYKIAKYWPEKGQSGFRVWRYLLRRDDPAPAPWTKAGIKRSKELGLTMQYPEGYDPTGGKDKYSKTGVGNKRPSRDDLNDSSSKRPKLVKFKLSSAVEDLIKSDELNCKLWEDCLAVVSEGLLKFNEKVKENFMCICCQDLLFKPVTTGCKHNFCHSCLTRACESLNNTCPACRESLGKPPELNINETLRDILNNLFQGYGNGRD